MSEAYSTGNLGPSGYFYELTGSEPLSTETPAETQNMLTADQQALFNAISPWVTQQPDAYQKTVAAATTWAMALPEVKAEVERQAEQQFVEKYGPYLWVTVGFVGIGMAAAFAAGRRTGRR